MNYEYEFSDSCQSVDAVLKDYLKSTDKSISCFTRINTNLDLEESDLNYCVEAMNEEKLVIKDFYNKTE